MNNIDVVVPCYNGQDVLPRCLDSLLRQMVPVNIIVVNDGSVDHTLSVAEEYAAQHPNIHIVNQENQGLPQARKSGLAQAAGEYVAFVDADDWVEPDMYEHLLNSLEKSKAEIACCGLFKSYDEGKNEIESQSLPDGSVLSPEAALHVMHCRRDVFPYMCNKLFRRSLFQDIVFPEGNFTGEDYVTIIQLLQKAGCIVTVNKALYHYYQSTSSMSRGGFKPSHVLSYRNYQDASYALISKFPSLQQDVSCYLAVEYMSFVIAMSRNGNYDQKMLFEIKHYLCKNLTSILSSKDMPMLYKGSAAAMSIHPKLLTAAYKLLNRFF